MSAVLPTSSRRVVPTGRLVALVAALALLVPGAGGNIFSLHVGMTSQAPLAQAATQAQDAPTVLEAAVSGEHGAVAGATAGGATPGPADSGAQHLMHLLGACLALVAAAVLLVLLLLRNRVGDDPGSRVTAASSDGRARSTAWRPPALSPPTSSPALRT